MTLKQYLSANGISLADFSARIGEKDRAVRNWYYGVRQPPLDIALKIEAATSGHVTGADMVVAERAA